MKLHQVFDGVADAFEFAGVVAMVIGFLVALSLSARRYVSREGGAFTLLRTSLGSAILLGLEILVAADLIRTITSEPSLENVGVLAIIVILRTILSWSIEIEIEGTLPWRRALTESGAQVLASTAARERDHHAAADVANSRKSSPARRTRAMAKTRPTGESVTDFIASIANARRRADTSTAVEMFRSVTGARPEMWGPSIIGFGRNPYTTADGAEHDWFTVGLSPRRQALTLYGISEAAHADLLDRLGPHTTGKGCLYVKNLADVDEEVLRRLVEISWRENDDAATTT